MTKPDRPRGEVRGAPGARNPAKGASMNEQRPDFEGMRWRDPYSYQARLREAKIDTNGVKNFKVGNVDHTDDRMLEGVDEHYHITTTRQDDGEVSAFVAKTDANHNTIAVELPERVITTITRHISQLQKQNRVRKGREAAGQRGGTDA